jgi:hypothetical protein
MHHKQFELRILNKRIFRSMVTDDPKREIWFSAWKGLNAFGWFGG